MESNPDIELEKLRHDVVILAKKLQDCEKARKRMEMLKNQNQKVLEKVNEELKQALKDLHTAEVQLIQAEKMASLGQLISGISHEINTPAASILASVSEINKDYKTLFESLLQIIHELPTDLHDSYMEACYFVIQDREGKSTADEREAANKIEQRLSFAGVHAHRNLCRELSQIGFDEKSVEMLIPLFKSETSKNIESLLIVLGMSRIHFSNIQIGIQRISSLVKALKLYSRFEMDELATTRLKEDIQTVLTILGHRLRDINVVFEVESNKEVRCYVDQLNQVWTNLINNSIEALKGKGQVIIRLKDAENEHIKVEIEDNGPGIPSEIKMRIFELYFTTKRKGEGTGLGLSICKEIIERHHGTIEVDSQPGKTVFKVLLPIDILKA